MLTNSLGVKRNWETITEKLEPPNDSVNKIILIIFPTLPKKSRNKR